MYGNHCPTVKTIECQLKSHYTLYKVVTLLTPKNARTILSETPKTKKKKTQLIKLKQRIRNGCTQARHQMGLHHSQHMDPMHKRLSLHLLHLLLRSKINPSLRPIHARHRVCLQRHRRQRRRPLRPPLLLRHNS